MEGHCLVWPGEATENEMELNPVTSKMVAFHTQGIAKTVFRITEAYYGYRRVGWNGIDDGRAMDSAGCSCGGRTQGS